MEITVKEAAEVYSGSSIQEYLIDRTAMGFPFDYIHHEFAEIFHSNISENDYEKFIKGKEELIKSRRAELQEQIVSQGVYGTLLDLKNELSETKTQALSNGDFRSYSQIVANLIRVIEIFMKSIETFKSEQSERARTLNSKNIQALVYLENKGVIVIKDKDELVKIFEAKP